jgi:hypothetical protein
MASRSSRAAAAPDEVLAWLRDEHAGVAELAVWVRSALLAAEPDLGERIYRGWGGVGYHHPDAGYVCAIFPRDGEVRLLFEHGARLADPDGVLEGDGTQTRYLTVREPGGGTADAVTAVLGRAVTWSLANRSRR